MVRNTTPESINWVKDAPIGILVRNISRTPIHIHDNLIEFIMCLNGSLELFYFYEDFRIKPGEFLLINKDCHFITGSEDSLAVSIYIDKNHFEEKFPHLKHKLFVCEGIFSLYNNEKNVYFISLLKKRLLCLMYYILSDFEQPSSNKLSTSAEEILILLMEQFDISMWLNPSRSFSKEAIERCDFINSYLWEHYNENITLASLAKELNISEIYLSEFISKYSHSFKKQLFYIRACKAEFYLINTKLSVVEISEACGFSDPKYFYSAFKRWHGITPGEFRKRCDTSAEKIASIDDKELNTRARHILSNMITKEFIDTFL